MGVSHYCLSGDASITSMPSQSDAEYIEEQDELDFRAPFGRDKVVQDTHMAVGDDTVAVKHFENEEDLADA